MNKRKVWIFVAIIVVLVGILLLKEDKPEVATGSYELEAGQYQSGEDFEPGVYDIVSTSDSMNYSGEVLDEGEKILGEPIENQMVILVEGEGTVQLVPAEKEPVEENEDGELVFDTAGYYDVGTQIEPGTYEASIRIEGEMDTELDNTNTPVMFLHTGYGVEDEQIDMYCYEAAEDNIIELERGQVVQISMHDAPEGVELVLTRQ